MMKPDSTKNTSTANCPRGASEGNFPEASNCMVAEKCMAITAIAATPRKDVRGRISFRAPPPH